MRRSFVAGNWKMNGGREFSRSLADSVRGLDDLAKSVDIAVCPPYVYLPDVAAILADSSVSCGAQDLSTHSEGAYTGDISAAMLLDVGCRYAIVGHSERRAGYGESNELVAQKASVAQHAGLIPIICVGEQLQERESGETENVIARQVDALLAVEDGLALLNNAVIAYEPVWAIGTGKTATPEQAQDVHAFIRARIADQDQRVAEQLQILYGGSVKANNAAELFAMDDIDGGLIGGASLVFDDFKIICEAARN